jgi:hypothetical protein
MRKKAKQGKTYSINELARGTKKIIFQKYRTAYADDSAWQEDILACWKDALEKEGFSNPVIYFSALSKKKGSACFELREFDVTKFAEKYKPFFARLFPEITKYMSIIKGNVTFHIYAFSKTKKPRPNCFWSHTNEYEHNGKTLSEAQTRMLDKKLFRILGYILSICTKTGEEIYGQLVNEYKRLTSDAYLQEALNASGVKFQLLDTDNTDKHINPDSIICITNNESTTGGKS